MTPAGLDDALLPGAADVLRRAVAAATGLVHRIPAPEAWRRLDARWGTGPALPAWVAATCLVVVAVALGRVG
ncbi:MAG TPA: hypothetical protein VGD03_07610 [Frankiaceae bacterium]